MNDPIPEILHYERRVWDALVNGDMDADAQLLHAGFIGVYPDGFADKSTHTGQLGSGPTVHGYTLDQIRTERIGPEHALICYRATFRRIKRETTEQMFVSSIWRKNGSGWINLFSQDTPAS